MPPIAVVFRSIRIDTGHTTQTLPTASCGGAPALYDLLSLRLDRQRATPPRSLTRSYSRAARLRTARRKLAARISAPRKRHELSELGTKTHSNEGRRRLVPVVTSLIHQADAIPLYARLSGSRACPAKAALKQPPVRMRREATCEHASPFFQQASLPLDQLA